MEPAAAPLPGLAELTMPDFASAELVKMIPPSPQVVPFSTMILDIPADRVDRVDP